METKQYQVDGIWTSAICRNKNKVAYLEKRGVWCHYCLVLKQYHSGLYVDNSMRRSEMKGAENMPAVTIVEARG